MCDMNSTLKLIIFLLISISAYSLVTSAQKNRLTNEQQDRLDKVQEKHTFDQTFDLMEQSPFVWDTTTHYANNYRVSGATVTQLKVSGLPFQITGLDPLPQRSNTTFYINSQHRQGMIFGIITGSRKQYQYSGYYGDDQKQSVGYVVDPSTREGGIIVDGYRRTGPNASLFVPQGGQLLMSVDLTVPSITYINKVTDVTQTFPIGRYFQEQKVYVFVVLLDHDDSISVVEPAPFWDKTTQYAKYYTVDYSRITRKGADGNWYQITGLQPLPLRSTTIFKIYANDKYGLVFGIITSSRKQNATSGGLGPDQNQSVGYRNFPSDRKVWVCVDGVTTVEWDASLFVPKGGQLSMTVDLIVPSITFVNKANNTNITFPIGKHFQEQKVYVFAGISGENDSVSAKTYDV